MEKRFGFGVLTAKGAKSAKKRIGIRRGGFATRPLGTGKGTGNFLDEKVASPQLDSRLRGHDDRESLNLSSNFGDTTRTPRWKVVEWRK